MNRHPHDPADRAWPRLAARASTSPAVQPAAEAPLGFATRVVAQWKSHPREASFALLEWLALRGVAVAVVILLGSAALSYDTLFGIFTGETALAGGWIDSLLTL
ncbi:hypothetical protein [Roseimicrobium sp. ORNL1]|uniref:hypothetical protein n=1 Tax=Roseimicrobium sp. ORNL1 TaxID=2711231 RepID=UPI0013E1254A|nr:hypothetical protein [Roseimicrobium sp. ORNL1]QIF00329.1 hypothetical protein G5S37_01900 [Roseimicrobium sp. ORNL1]